MYIFCHGCSSCDWILQENVVYVFLVMIRPQMNIFYPISPLNYTFFSDIFKGTLILYVIGVICLISREVSGEGKAYPYISYPYSNWQTPVLIYHPPTSYYPTLHFGQSNIIARKGGKRNTPRLR